MESKLPILDTLYSDVSHLIEDTHNRVAVTVNAELTMLYWRIGRRINEEVLQGKRALHNQEIVKNLGKSLTTQYGKGWGEKQLWNYMRFADTFSESSRR